MSASFKCVQEQFVKAIKEPSSFQSDCADQRRRMQIYQSLFFNNINNFVSTGFPVLKSVVTTLHNEAAWDKLVRDFFITHSCRSPYFAEISKEFVEYLSKANQFPVTLPDFSAELAHYEWLELDVSIRRNEDNAIYSTKSELTGTFRVSPYASIASYRYAVHLIGEDYIPEKPADEQQYYVVYRDEQCSVEFVHMNLLTAILLNTIERFVEQHHCGIAVNELTSILGQQLPHIPTDTLEKGVEHTMVDMLNKGILMPTCRS